MDSTFLGTLLFFRRALQCRGPAAFSLVSPSVECQQLLKQMALTPLFPVVVEDEPPAEAWNDLRCELDDAESGRRSILQAHRELASLDSPACEPFRAAVAPEEEKRAE
jgi:hypothetical protein